VGTDAITVESLGDELSAKSTSTVLNQVATPGSQEDHEQIFREASPSKLRLGP